MYIHDTSWIVAGVLSRYGFPTAKRTVGKILNVVPTSQCSLEWYRVNMGDKVQLLPANQSCSYSEFIYDEEAEQVCIPGWKYWWTHFGAIEATIPMLPNSDQAGLLWERDAQGDVNLFALCDINDPEYDADREFECVRKWTRSKMLEM
jgi:hypothetical protein